MLFQSQPQPLHSMTCSLVTRPLTAAATTSSSQHPHTPPRQHPRLLQHAQSLQHPATPGRSPPTTAAARSGGFSTGLSLPSTQSRQPRPSPCFPSLGFPPSVKPTPANLSPIKQRIRAVNPTSPVPPIPAAAPHASPPTVPAPTPQPRQSKAAILALGCLGLISLFYLSFLATAELAVLGAWNLQLLLIHSIRGAHLIPTVHMGNWLIGWVPAVAAVHAVVYLLGFLSSSPGSVVRYAVGVGAAAAIVGGLAALLPTASKKEWNTAPQEKTPKPGSESEMRESQLSMSRRVESETGESQLSMSRRVESETGESKLSMSRHAESETGESKLSMRRQTESETRESKLSRTPGVQSRQGSSTPPVGRCHRWWLNTCATLMAVRAVAGVVWGLGWDGEVGMNLFAMCMNGILVSLQVAGLVVIFVNSSSGRRVEGGVRPAERETAQQANAGYAAA